MPGDPSFGEHYRVAFETNLGIDAAQADSRIAAFCDAEFNYAEKGDSFTVDNIGNSDPSPLENRYGNLPEDQIEHRRRVGHFEPWHDGKILTSSLDNARMVADPTNSKVKVMKQGLARRQDAMVIAAMGGVAYSGRNGTTSNALPAAQKIAVNNHAYDAGTGDVSLTVSKVMLAKEMLDASEIMGPRHLAVTAKMVSHMLTDSQVTSSDFNTVKALVAGEINEWMGFTWHRYENLPADGSADLLAYAWVEDAICYRQRTLYAPDVWLRKDRAPHWYAYYQIDQAATRREDVGVVQIACDPN